MDTIHIKSLEEHNPGYKDRNLIWCKVYFKMINADPNFEMLCETDKWRFVALVMLELQIKEPVPLDPKYLARKGFDFKKRPMSLTIQMLHNLVEVRNDSVTQIRVEKSRVDKKREENIYDIFRKYYPGEKRGLDTEFNYFCKTHSDWKEILPLLLPAVKREESRRADLEGANKFVPNWKHLKTWIYNRCWEVTSGQTVTVEENADREKQVLEKRRAGIRTDYGDYYREQSPEKLAELRKDKTHFVRWWLIDEIANEQRNTRIGL